MRFIIASQTSSTPLGMCLDAGPDPNNNDPVEFQPCGTNTLPQQQWNINDSYGLKSEATYFLDIGDDDRTGEASVLMLTIGLTFR